MSEQLTFWDEIESPSSPASVGGSAPFASPGGQQISQCGASVAPALHSPLPAKRKPARSVVAQTLSRALDELASSFAASASTPGAPTSDTSGQKCGESSASAYLQSCLENRLVAAMERFGSLEYELRWNYLDTPLGVRILRRVASARRTSETDSSGSLFGIEPLPLEGCATPRGAAGGQTARPDGSVRNLEDQAALAGWQTPTMEDSSNRTHTYSQGDHSKPFLCLPGQAMLTQEVVLAGWQTPMASEDKARSARTEAGRTQLNPLEALFGWATPASRDYKDDACEHANVPTKGLLGRQADSLPPQQPGAATSSSPVATASIVASRLNPLFSLWLMGFPVLEWVASSPGWQSAEWAKRMLADYCESLRETE